MASENFNEMAELVDNVRLLKNQQEESSKKMLAQIKEFLDKERANSNEILDIQKTIFKEHKQEKYKTYSRYFFVGAGCSAIFLALGIFGSFLYFNWLYKDTITQRAELQAQLEITKKAEAKAIEAEREFNESKKEDDSEKADYEASLKRLKLTNKDSRLFFSKHGDEISFQCWDTFCGITFPKDKVLVDYHYTIKDQYGDEVENDMCNEKVCTLFLKK